MGLVINTNMAALNSGRILGRSTEEQAKSYQRIASGQRITSAADDAAGLAISERLRTQIRSQGQASRNTNQAIAFSQVAEGALNEISNNLIRVRELGIQAASDTVGDLERSAMNQESQGLIQEISRIANSTSFNGVTLLNGSGSTLSFQVGIKNTENDHIDFNIKDADVRSATLGIEGVDMTTLEGARESLDALDLASNKVLSTRASLGSIQNRLQSTFRTSEDLIEGLTGARSNITDTDISAETSNLMRANILQQAGIAILAQANSSPAQVLKLL